MISKIYTVAVVGLSGELVEVEVDIKPGLFKFNIVGLPDKAITESKDRVAAAIRNSGYDMPNKKITVNLAPAELVKTGTSYDLPIALGILTATKQIQSPPPTDIIWGELALDGFTRNTTGALAVADTLRMFNKDNLFLPEINAQEAGIIAGINVYPVKTLVNIVDHYAGNNKISTHKSGIIKPKVTQSKYDFKNIVGQNEAKRVLEIAAAGGHNVLITGSPGSGKTYLARSLPSILPRLTYQEIIDVTKIYSISGLLGRGALIEQRPFRSPHHTSSRISIIGGGTIPKPGEITLAHRGVLFMDEFNEFDNKTLEALRQPIEDKVVNISRVAGVMEYPANFMLIAALNPCKCGYLDDESTDCICSSYDIEKYKKKISGPIIDRIDMQLNIKRVPSLQLISKSNAESSETIRDRVEKARKLQYVRMQSISIDNISINSDLNNVLVKKLIKLNQKSRALLKSAMDNLNLSARSYYRVLKVSRTIADLDGAKEVSDEHIAEALSYRLERG